MTRIEHLLTILAEECAEVAQRASKALRFSTLEVQPGQEFTNAERIMHEYADLVAIYELLVFEGLLPNVDRMLVAAKKDKVEDFLRYSAECGTLDEAKL